MGWTPAQFARRQVVPAVDQLPATPMPEATIAERWRLPGAVPAAWGITPGPGGFPPFLRPAEQPREPRRIALPLASHLRRNQGNPHPPG